MKFALYSVFTGGAFDVSMPVITLGGDSQRYSSKPGHRIHIPVSSSPEGGIQSRRERFAHEWIRNSQQFRTNGPQPAQTETYHYIGDRLRKFQLPHAAG